MELKDFVKTVLIDLINGVDEAKKELGRDGSLVCAPIGHAYTKEFGLSFDANGRHHQKVEFDVAVTAGEESIVESKASGKAGFIKVLSLSANIDGSLKSSNSTISRVKFHVPIALKCTNLKDSEES